MKCCYIFLMGIVFLYFAQTFTFEKDAIIEKMMMLNTHFEYFNDVKEFINSNCHDFEIEDLIKFKSILKNQKMRMQEKMDSCVLGGFLVAGVTAIATLVYIDSQTVSFQDKNAEGAFKIFVACTPYALLCGFVIIPLAHRMYRIQNLLESF